MGGVVTTKAGIPGELRVWWIPQVPMSDPFIVKVATVAEGAKIIEVLANYDLYQLRRRIKPDYCNMGGLQMFEDGEWTDWEQDGYTDPEEFVAANPSPDNPQLVVREQP